MRTSEQIKNEITEKFGFFPPFFSPALQNPQILENLWQQTLFAYVNNPLSPLFKEKLSAYLSRYCAVPYCMICHSCALRPLGVKAKEVLELLESPPPIETEIDQHFSFLANQSEALQILPESNLAVSENFLYCAIYISLEGNNVQYYRSELRRIVGELTYQYLTAFIAYVKTCHVWMEAHPEIGYADDRRVIEHLQALVEEEPGLDDFFRNYRENVKSERQTWEEKMAAIAQQKKNEAAMRQRQKQLADFFENAAIALHWLGADGRIIWANQAELNLLGYTRDEYIGLHISAFHADSEVMKDLLARLANNETIHNYEAQLRCKDGSIKLVSISSNVLYENGKFVHIRTFTRDITESKQAEMLLAGQKSILEMIATNASLTDVLNSLAAMIEQQSTDISCSILLLDQNGVTLRLGAAPSFPQTYIQAIKDGLKISAIAGSCGTAAYLGQPVIVTDIANDPLWIDYRDLALSHGFRACWSVPIFAPNGNVLGTFGMFYRQPRQPSSHHQELIKVAAHIAGIAIARKRTEEALRESEEKFRNLVEQTNDWVWEIDQNGTFTYVNPQASKIIGYESAEIVGKATFDFMVGDEVERFSQVIGKFIAQQQPFAQLEKTLIHKSGEAIVIETSGSPIFNQQGNLQGYRGIARDTTERKQTEEALRQSEQRFRFLSEVIPQQVWTATPNGAIDYVNQRVLDYFDRTSEEMLDWGWQKLVHPDDLPNCIKKWVKSLKTGVPYEVEFRLLRASDRTYRWHIARALPLRDRQGNILSWFGTCTDIDDLKRTEEALRESDTRLKLALEAASMDSWDWHIPTSTATWSDCYQNFIACVYPDKPEVLTQPVKNALEKGADYNIEYQTIRTDGSFSWTATKGRVFHDIGGIAVRMTGVDMDISDRKRMEEQLRHDAFYDNLTGLPNRALFTERLSYLIKHRKQSEHSLFSVLFIDLDRFKIVNDSLGHLVGDQLLINIARRLETCLRSSDIVARLGGDEFAILLENVIDINDAIQVAERIQDQLSIPFNLSGQEVFTSASIGIALSTSDYEQIEDFLRDADTAMYRAKALGKARYEIFNTVMHTRAVSILHLETDLRRAVERQELRLYYQPIVELQTGKIKGFEALVRWQHPERGFVCPDEFITLAEETGLIISIGKWVLGEACRQMQIWQQLFPQIPPLSISVNLSGKQLSQPDLIEQIEHFLDCSSLNPQSLKLEITESVLIEHTESAANLLLKLQKLGIQLYMDDFGTGYSSLSYLHRFPINSLKIDRSFISRIGSKGENSEIVRAIVGLAHNLGMNVIAEGIETSEQLTQLQLLKCNDGQGYFFSKPLDSVKATGLIEIHYAHQVIHQNSSAQKLIKSSGELMSFNF